MLPNRRLNIFVAAICDPLPCATHVSELVCPIPARGFPRCIVETRTAISPRAATWFRLLALLYSRRPCRYTGTKRHPIPIASVRRKRQRLPSSLLIENASAPTLTSSLRLLCAEAFPMKASDDSPGRRVPHQTIARFTSKWIVSEPRDPAQTQ